MIEKKRQRKFCRLRDFLENCLSAQWRTREAKRYEIHREEREDMLGRVGGNGLIAFLHHDTFTKGKLIYLYESKYVYRVCTVIICI